MNDEKFAKPVIALTCGDYAGIGPELLLKTLAITDLELATPLIICPTAIIDYYSALLDLPISYNCISSIEELRESQINVLDIQLNLSDITPGTPSAETGLVAMRSIEEALKICSSGLANAIVTAPISKEMVNAAGYSIPGHTEFLAERTNTHEVLMTLVSGKLRVAIVTTHIPVKLIHRSLSVDLITSKLKILNESLIKDFCIEEPKIAVFGLNPHAGDGGVIGNEEIDIIIPAIEKAKSIGIKADGPFPADGFFGQKQQQNFDAILAMYHDQGLVPFKALTFGKGINFTAGLPIIRTSPDHGTAFDIAGKGIASHTSFKEAFNLAVELSISKMNLSEQ